MASATIAINREAAAAVRQAAKDAGVGIGALATEALLGHPQVWDAFVALMTELGEPIPERPEWVTKEGVVIEVPKKRRVKIYGKVI